MSQQALSPMAVYSAFPTVRIEGEDNQKVTGLVLEMEMIEREGGLSSLELHVSNIASDDTAGADFAFEDDEVLKLGAAIAIYAGDQTGPQEIFQGKITGLELVFEENQPPELVVLAEDAFQLARMKRVTKVHDDANIAALARELASDLSLTPVITGLDANIGVQVQINESNLAFLRRLAARYDADLQVVGTELHVSPLADVRRGEIELAVSGQLRSVRMLADLAHQVTEATSSGWDIARGERVTGAATGTNLGPGQGRTGAEILQDTLGERTEHVPNLAATTSDEAQAIADAVFDARARRFLTVRGEAQGNPALRVGTHVTITGAGPRFSNVFYVTEAIHRFNLESGYGTEFRAECAYLGSGG
jgi:phage protein D